MLRGNVQIRKPAGGIDLGAYRTRFGRALHARGLAMRGTHFAFVERRAGASVFLACRLRFRGRSHLAVIHPVSTLLGALALALFGSSNALAAAIGPRFGILRLIRRCRGNAGRALVALFGFTCARLCAQQPGRPFGRLGGFASRCAISSVLRRAACHVLSYSPGVTIPKLSM